MNTFVGWAAFYIVIGLIVLAVVAGIVGRLLVERGIREPIVVRAVNRASESVVDVIKRPLTVAILDEVAEVVQSGHYTQNLAAALQENHEQIKDLIAQKVTEDPVAGRIGLIPFHDRIVRETTETALRVLLAVLADPRTDELVSDLLRDNFAQLRQTIRQRQAAAAMDGGLRGTGLRGTDLRGADLRGADLRGTGDRSADAGYR